MMTEPLLNDPYLVKKGDTLSKIAQKSGQSINKLMLWNNLKNANVLEIGQTLYLSEKTAFGVSVLFLDAMRSPIENLKYRIRFDDQVKSGTTASNGRIPMVITKDAKSQVEVLVQDLQGKWIKLCTTVSGYGHKLTTLVSNSVVFKGQTEKHPKEAPAKPTIDKPTQKATPNTTSQAPLPPKSTGAPSKNNPMVKTKKTKGKKGQAIIQIGVEIPEGLLTLFGNYQGGEISAAEWEEVAGSLECEPAVLKAVASVESGGALSFWRLNKADGANIPAILFERHYFSRLTKGVYDKDHPDISWPIGYKKSDQIGKKNKGMHDGEINADDVYGDYASAYLRLIQAYKLNPDAALKSCSWGKFQVMGANHSVCGTKDLEIFVQTMCTSEKAQIELLAAFIQNKPSRWKDTKNKKLGKEISLWDAVKTKDWASIAFNYNGPGYRENNYHTKMEAAYKEHSKT